MRGSRHRPSVAHAAWSAREHANYGLIIASCASGKEAVLTMVLVGVFSNLMYCGVAHRTETKFGR